MDKPRPCGCKGCRTCLICESTFGLSAKKFARRREDTYVYCPQCNVAFPGWDPPKHPDHSGAPITFPGIYIQLDFLTPEEEAKLMQGIDDMSWDSSQSGRRKQNFGPKCNFKKNKLREGDFTGFPKFTEFVQEKFRNVPILSDFQTIEQCSLEYDPEKGASIDPHVDDCWVWGERVVTVNLLSDSVLTMTYNRKNNYYNLHLVGKYPAVLDEKGDRNFTESCYKVKEFENDRFYPTVRVPMPRRSLLVMFNSARYDWEHQILREDIRERRVCLAYREFTPIYLKGGDKEQEGAPILRQARNFWEHLR
ncbi:alpha-ketoglutarate-dependent dioxygenase alkB homolog 4 [Tribolium castaneum]|uniref:Alpha-ketoglutarate-dependent dioxygenase alkB homolog 4-like Protein n=1 Tax=Tribolium castaneum TaxID=7070 RepID=D6WUI0_TRICA|nr:PREDICTED: alpha-ketoglutarate-dependent dioxygenase alkB homolog 4 [Tribolium castaneum]EFA08384.1 Alpha-ketoglutarate-dependent dioxygenase alkB homolog 4-like Protein [Tribolium castaneum]|eukprot:XP_971924.1 PREDICTED: alpha-ketoglutarate-dependent dioxygenase alkB homolog 4 [Tribolium castaneum]